MLKQRLQVAQNVASFVNETEVQLDSAIERAADLVQTMVAGRIACKVGANVGHEAISKTLEALELMGQARAALVQAHKEMQITQEQVGLGRVSMVGLTKYENAAPAEVRHEAAAE